MNKEQLRAYIRSLESRFEELLERSDIYIQEGAHEAAKRKIFEARGIHYALDQLGRHP